MVHKKIAFIIIYSAMILGPLSVMAAAACEEVTTPDPLTKSKLVHFCFNKQTKFLISKNCQANAKCQANIEFSKLKSKNLPTTQYASPDAVLCQMMKGKYQELSFEFQKKKITEPTCYFYKDQSFVGTRTLLSATKKRFK
jgi:hypothetical protein